MKLTCTKVFIFIVVSLISSKIKAQQDPHYSQFMYNKLNFNPGYAGSTDGKICATLLNRAQWLGFGGKNTLDPNSPNPPQGDAPTNLVGSLNAALTPDNSKFLSRIGLGLVFSKDQLGFETTTMPKFSFAYRHPIGDQSYLSAGVGVGIMQKSLDGSKLKSIDPGDPKIPNSMVKGTGTDIDFGLYYTRASLGGLFDNFYAGFSTTHVNQSKIAYSWGSNSVIIDNKMHYYFVTGAEYQINASLKLQPNIIVKKDPAKLQTDINCFAIINDNIRGGLTFRPMDAVVVLVGYEFPFGLNLGYSYDLTTSKIIKYSSGSHELMIRYCFGIKIPTKVKPIRSRVTPRFM